MSDKMIYLTSIKTYLATFAQTKVIMFAVATEFDAVHESINPSHSVGTIERLIAHQYFERVLKAISLLCTAELNQIMTFQRRALH